MPALVAGIHVFGPSTKKVVDGRNKSGHDEAEASLSIVTTVAARITSA